MITTLCFTILAISTVNQSYGWPLETPCGTRFARANSKDPSLVLSAAKQQMSRLITMITRNHWK